MGVTTTSILTKAVAGDGFRRYVRVVLAHRRRRSRSPANEQDLAELTAGRSSPGHLQLRSVGSERFGPAAPRHAGGLASVQRIHTGTVRGVDCGGDPPSRLIGLDRRESNETFAGRLHKFSSNAGAGDPASIHARPALSRAGIPSDSLVVRAERDKQELPALLLEHI